MAVPASCGQQVGASVMFSMAFMCPTLLVSAPVLGQAAFLCLPDEDMVS